MTNQHDRLRQARIAAGYRFATRAAEAFGWNVNSYKSNENGNAPFSYDQGKVYARAFKVSPVWLYDDDFNGPMRNNSPHQHGAIRSLSIEGKVAAGATGYFDSDGSPGSGNDVMFDPDEITLTLQVEGDSMVPRFKDRDIVCFGYRYDDPTPLIGREVMAQEANNGRKLLKVLQEGSAPGLWTLYSVNTSYDPIKDIELDWVLPVKWVKV